MQWVFLCCRGTRSTLYYPSLGFACRTLPLGLTVPSTQVALHPSPLSPASRPLLEQSPGSAIAHQSSYHPVTRPSMPMCHKKHVNINVACPWPCAGDGIVGLLLIRLVLYFFIFFQCSSNCFGIRYLSTTKLPQWESMFCGKFPAQQKREYWI